MPISDSQTLREGRNIYFAEHGLPADGGYEDPLVVFRVKGIPVFAFPNTADRKAAVPFHDLHHVVTGYGTSPVGEAEIGAWELASDCSASRAATLLNLEAFSMRFFYRERIFAAFMRGRRSENLYGRAYDDALLETRVAQMREELGIDAPERPPTPEDLRDWRRWVRISNAFLATQFLLLVTLGWWLLS